MKKTLVFLVFLFSGCATYYPPEAPFSKISPASDRTRPAGPTVKIRNIYNLDPGPIEMVMAEELSRHGYSLISSGRESSGSPFDNSYWERRVRSDWRTSECQACDRVDYLIEVGARPVSVGHVGGSASASRYGYGASGYGERVVNQVEIYIAFYDGRTGRVIPGKTSVTRVRVRNFGAFASEVLTRAFGVQGFAQEQIYDPITEAAVRTIPQMFH